MSTSAQQQLVATAAKGKYGSLGRALADLILAQIGFALAGVNILGMHPLFFLEAWATNLTQDAANAINGAAQANSGVAATNSDLAMTGGKPLHEGMDVTADSTILYTNAINNIHCNINAAAWGFIRIGRTDQKQTVTTIAKQSSGVTTLLRFDIYRLETDGSVTLIAQTANIAPVLTTSYAWIQSPFNNTLPVTYGDILAVQCIVDTGVVDIAGLVSVSAVNNINRPYQLGGLRDAAASQSPATIPAATVDAMYTNAVPFFQLGSAAAADIEPRAIADDFQNGLGKWILSNGGGSGGLLGISGGQLTYSGSDDGYEAGIYQVPLISDDFNCAADVGGSLPSTFANAPALIMASNRDKSTYVGLFIGSNRVALLTTVSGSSLATVASKSRSGNAGRWFVTYRSATRTWSVYYGADDSTPPVITWVEPAGSAWHGIGQRYFGLRITHAFFAAWGAWDNFSARDWTS